jgi:signal transduction histidine kinase
VSAMNVTQALEGLPEAPADAMSQPAIATAISSWESWVRRALLVAHAAPALFGIVAVTVVEDARALDVAVWVLVAAWSFFLLIGGWKRAETGAGLTRWVLADALVMALLLFIGTPARQVVNYVAIDGALFSAVFVSTRVALLQMAVAYSGLALAAIVRSAGSEIPSPPAGWLLPVLVPLGGILALRFLRRALDSLYAAGVAREQAIRDSARVRAEAAREEALVRSLAPLDETMGPALRSLATLAREYSAETEDSSAHSEARWLLSCVELAADDLAKLRTVVEEVDLQDVEEALDTGVLGATAVRVLSLDQIHRRVDPSAAAVLLGLESARAVTGFVREAVTNAVVHGRPPIRVRASYDSGFLHVSVSDHGAGFDPQSVERGLGLDAIERLASATDATIDHESSRGGGHTITLRLRVQ